MHPNVLDATLRAVAGSLGRKLVYAQFGDGVKQHQARRALELLAGARVCHLVRHSAANGLPLGAEAKDTFRKAILADVGLADALLGTPAAAAFPSWTDLAPAVRGQLADQWRDSSCVSSTRSPATVRSSSTGSERAVGPGLPGGGPGPHRPGRAEVASRRLHEEPAPVHVRQDLDLAVRCDANPPSVMDVSVTTTLGDPCRIGC